MAENVRDLARQGLIREGPAKPLSQLWSRGLPPAKRTHQEDRASPLTRVAKLGSSWEAVLS